MKFNRKTLVVKNEDPQATPMTLGTLAEEHYNSAVVEDEPISIVSAWQYAIDEIRLGSYRIVETPGDWSERESACSEAREKSALRRGA